MLLAECFVHFLMINGVRVQQIHAFCQPLSLISVTHQYVQTIFHMNTEGEQHYDIKSSVKKGSELDWMLSFMPIY